MLQYAVCRARCIIISNSIQYFFKFLCDCFGNVQARKNIAAAGPKIGTFYIVRIIIIVTPSGPVDFIYRKFIAASSIGVSHIFFLLFSFFGFMLFACFPAPPSGNQSKHKNVFYLFSLTLSLLSFLFSYWISWRVCRTNRNYIRWS